MLLLLFLSFACANAKVKLFITDSPTIQIAGRTYKREYLTFEYNDPRELAYDPGTRNLFFMYMDDDLQNSGRAVINVETKESMKIKGIRFNRATAVDRETGDVYFGSENGLYKYDRTTNEAMHLGLYNVNVLKLVARDGDLYLIDANNHMLYKVLLNGTAAIRLGNWKTVMEFDVDYENNVHFVTMCGVFCAVKGHETVKNKDLNVAYNFMFSKNTTLAVTDEGIYSINCLNGTAEKLGKIDFVPRSIILGDDGEMYYSLDNNIFKLKPINHYYVYNIYKKNN